MDGRYQIEDGQFDDADECGKKLEPTVSAVAKKLKQIEFSDKSSEEVWSEDDYDSGEDWDDAGQTHQGPNAQNRPNKVLSFQPSDKLFKKFSNKINVEKYEGPESLSGSAANKLIGSDKKAFADKLRFKDKKDRATAEQVMDPRTRMVLFKLLNRGVVTEVNGCISTGKEANVYHALGRSGSDLAIKVYKTSILVFKVINMKF